MVLEVFIIIIIYFNCKWVSTRWYTTMRHNTQIPHITNNTTMKRNTAHKSTHTIHTYHANCHTKICLFVLFFDYLYRFSWWIYNTVLTLIIYTFFLIFLIKNLNSNSGGWSPIGSTRHCRHQWPMVPAPGDYDGDIGGMIGRGNRRTRRKPAPVLLCPPQTPHAARTRTRAAAVGSQRLTVSGTVRP
jgi:hypothetical protein